MIATEFAQAIGSDIRGSQKRLSAQKIVLQGILLVWRWHRRGRERGGSSGYAETVIKQMILQQSDLMSDRLRPRCFLVCELQNFPFSFLVGHGSRSPNKFLRMRLDHTRFYF
jgi:hypothetical protein